jgi:hypothetical protein
MPSFHRGRFAVGAAAVVGALALAGCGSGGVMHDGSTALEYDGHTVTAAQLQTAADEISHLPSVNATIAPMTVAQRLAIGPEVLQFAASKGQAPITDSQIQASSKTPLSPTALEALRIDALIGTMADNAQLDNAQLKALSEKADVTVNPRYGTWVKGTGITAASQPWVSSTPTATAAVPGGHPAE